jgi:hypothetical protein
MSDDIRKETIGDEEAKTQAQIDLERKILELQKDQSSTVRDRIRLRETERQLEVDAQEAEIKRIQDLATLSQELLSNKEKRLQLSEEEVKFHERRTAASAQELATLKERFRVEQARKAQLDDMQGFTDNLIERLTGIGAPKSEGFF